MELKLYHYPSSVCAQKVRLVLEDLNLKWDSVIVDIHAGEQLAKEYLRLNPKGVVPTLVKDDQIIVESNVIIEYLADAYFKAGEIRPREPFRRAQMRLWLKKLDDGLHKACAIITGAANSADRAAAIQRSGLSREQYFSAIPDLAQREWLRNIIDNGVEAPEVLPAMQCYDETLAEMGRVLAAQPYLAGGEYSLADAGLTPYIVRLDRLGMSEIFVRRPAVVAWYERMCARPNFTAAITKFDVPARIETLRSGGAAAWAALKPKMVLDRK